MANETNDILKSLITSVQKRPQFDASGRETQVVVVSYETPSGFTGTLTLPWATWKDEQARAEALFQEIADLEGPFWRAGVEAETEG